MFVRQPDIKSSAHTAMGLSWQSYLGRELLAGEAEEVKGCAIKTSKKMKEQVTEGACSVEGSNLKKSRGTQVYIPRMVLECYRRR